MIAQEQIEELKELLQRAQSVLVVLDSKVSFDQQVAGCSLYLALQKLGKRVELVAADELNNKTILGTQDLKTSIGNRNLLISFDYDEHAVGKVSYHIDDQDNKFFLTIKPEAGFPSLDPETVKFEKTGSDSELIFLVGVDNLANLKQLYFGYESLYEDVPTIAINNHEMDYASLTLDFSSYSCASEGLYNVISNFEFELDSAIATNLFSAISHSTENFASLTASAYTFEVAAELIKAGARRSRPKRKNVVKGVVTSQSKSRKGFVKKEIKEDASTEKKKEVEVELKQEKKKDLEKRSDEKINEKVNEKKEMKEKQVRQIRPSALKKA